LGALESFSGPETGVRFFDGPLFLAGIFGNILIHLTRLNGAEIVVNADLIEILEATPETVVTLTSGKKHTVKESLQEIVARVTAYRREIVKPVVKGQ
jgi:flagellar protein FlbD